MSPAPDRKKGEARQVAAIELNAGLKSVWNWLEKTRKAGARGDVEIIHQLRVSSRRAHAALSMFQKLADPGEVAAMKESLRQIRKAADSARDLDVLKEHCVRGLHLLAASSADKSLQGEPSKKIIARFEGLRVEAQKPLVSLASELAANEFPRHITLLVSGIRASQHKKAGRSFGHWARKGVRRSAKKFLQAIVTNYDEVDDVHHMRIRAKKLRYALELAGDSFECSGAYPAKLELFQDAAGEMRDCTLAAQTFLEWRLAAPPEERAFLEGLFQGVLRASEGLGIVAQKIWTAEDTRLLTQDADH